MTDDQKKNLQTQLWKIANELRGKMDADEFRDYILGFIFYKYLSEKLQLYADEILQADGLSYEDLDEAKDTDQPIIEAVKKAALDKLGYFLTPSELFHNVAIRGAENGNMVETLEKILGDIERSTMGTQSEEDFDKLFSELDLNRTQLGRTVQDRSELLAKVLGHLDKIDFQLQNSQIDVLGDAYEYLIGQFASGAGKKAGEFYTPQEVSQILARLVTAGKTQLTDVYDPTCGSGSLLLRVAKYVKNVGHFYGQELNNTTYNLARMNMILHDVHFSRFDIKQEDTLKHPLHLEHRFEAVVANPPFSAHWEPTPLVMSDDRFGQYGKLAPQTKADYAFILHMLYQLAENGTMAVVMPHGVLFRGAAEGHIRTQLIKDKNYLDAVIGLPANIFYGTSIPTCILVFKKCRTHPNDVLFIDASKGFEKVKNQNRLRPEDIDKIIETYAKRQATDRYSYVANLKEIVDNDYNLNIPRYVDTFEEEEPIDLAAVTAEIKQLEASSAEIDQKIAAFCQELGIEPPFHSERSRTIGVER